MAPTFVPINVYNSKDNKFLRLAAEQGKNVNRHQLQSAAIAVGATLPWTYEVYTATHDANVFRFLTLKGDGHMVCPAEGWEKEQVYFLKEIK